jgi:hypothetical protein
MTPKETEVFVAELLAPQIERLAEKYFSKVRTALEELTAQRAAQRVEWDERLEHLRVLIAELQAQATAARPTEQEETVQ